VRKRPDRFELGFTSTGNGEWGKQMRARRATVDWKSTRMASAMIRAKQTWMRCGVRQQTKRKQNSSKKKNQSIPDLGQIPSNDDSVFIQPFRI